MKIDDEILIAYVDGELDPVRAAEVEAVVASDADVAARVRRYREDTAALRAAFNTPLRAPVPARLREALEAGCAKAAGKAAHPVPSGVAPRLRYWGFAALAASLVALIVGFGAANFMVDRQVERRIARLEAARAAERQMIKAAVLLALEKNRSGTPARWRNPDSGNSGLVEPVRTFRIASGQWCREYVQIFDPRSGSAGRQTRRAIACRGADGTWTTRLRLGEES